MEIKTAQMEKVIKIIGVIGDGTEKKSCSSHICVLHIRRQDDW